MSSHLQQLNNKAIYPFASLKHVGDAFFIDDYAKAESARVAGIQFVRRHHLDWKIGIRKVSGGWRVLRTA